MPASVVDEHRLILYRDGTQSQDITEFIGNLTATDELNALSVELTFDQILSPWDKYVPKLNLSPGDKVRVNNHGVDVYSGVIVKVGLDGSVTAYDQGWYLNKSQIIYQCSSLPADQAIKAMCAKAGIAVGRITSLPTVITQSWVGRTPSEILSDILSTCNAETGKEYQYRVLNDALTVSQLTTVPIVVYHKPTFNISYFDITWALGQVSGEDSMEEMSNAVVIAAEDDGKVYIGAEAKNTASIKKYGMLQKVETVTEDPGNAKLKQMAKNLLSQSDRIQRTRTIDEIWGADEVTSGVVLSFNSDMFGISGKQRVTKVTHHYGGAGHTMSLELQALEEPRAADTADSVTVYGLPDDLGSGGAEEETGDTIASSAATSGSGAARFVAVAAGEIGYRETGNNQNKYGAWAGNNGVAWCAYFVSWCAYQAGVSNLIPKNGSVSGMMNYFRGKGKFKYTGSYIPKAGDLMVQKNNASHIGIVESATASSVKTIEGNCSNRVRRMTRSYSEITGFCTPWG